MAHNLPGSTNDVSWTYAYNPAGQIVSQVRSNDVYAWTSGTNGASTYPINGLNQTGLDGAPLFHDLKGNLQYDGTHAYFFDQANRLTGGGLYGGTTYNLAYDPRSAGCSPATGPRPGASSMTATRSLASPRCRGPA